MLKSGGPYMTVSSIEQGQKVHCNWFDGNDVKHWTFRGHELRLEMIKDASKAFKARGSSA